MMTRVGWTSMFERGECCRKIVYENNIVYAYMDMKIQKGETTTIKDKINITETRNP